MIDIGTVWADARDRIIREFIHAPLGTTAAVIAMGELAWGLIGIAAGRQPMIPSGTAAIDHLTTGKQPSILPILQFVLFQIVIAFALQKVNAWASGTAISTRIVIGIPSTILAAYLTGWNAYYAAVSEISEGRHYGIFEGFWEIGFAITFVLLLALQVERQSQVKMSFGLLFNIALTVIPMALLFYLSCIFFDSEFMDSLEPIWAAMTRPSFPHP